MMMLSKLAERLRDVARAADVRPHKPAKPDPMIEVDAALRAQVSAESGKGSDIAPPVMSEKKPQVSDLPPITHPDRFPACLAIVLKHEGGYVNHPRDPGGRTNLGVTQRVWEAWIGRKATEQDMRALTPEMVAPLYRQKYWNKVRAAELAPGLDLHVFDFGVNAGPSRAIRYLQMMIGANPDGIFGPATMRALSNYIDQYGTRKAVTRYGELREQYYRSLRTFATFGRGWLRRNREVTAAALEMGK
jgi:lysozyme family protein